MRGNVVLITGGNTGIGFVTALELARQGAHVILACRSAKRANAARDQIQEETGNPLVETLELDLADLNSVYHAAQEILARDLPIHCLINNAGVAGARGITPSGFEMAFGTNHIGHFALTQWLLPRILASAPARIVTVASRAHRMAPGINFADLVRPTRTWLTLREYGVSKLANILFSAELARRLQGTGVNTYALHPGVVSTEIWRHVPRWIIQLRRKFMIAPQDGAKTTLYCASAPELENQTGLYYDRCSVAEPSSLAKNNVLAQELWRFSEVAVTRALQQSPQTKSTVAQSVSKFT